MPTYGLWKLSPHTATHLLSLLPECGCRPRSAPTGLPDIKFLRRRRQPHCPRPAPPDKSAELHHLTSRMKQVCRWDKQWKIGDIFPLSLSEASINIRDLHIFNPVLRSFQQIPIPAEKWGYSLGAYLSDIWSCVCVNPRLLISPASPPLPLADHQAPLQSTVGSAQCPAVSHLPGRVPVPTGNVNRSRSQQHGSLRKRSWK